MLDATRKWPAQPDWQDSVLASPRLTVRSLAGLDQQLVGGDLDAWSRSSGLDPVGTGALLIASGDPYCLRLGRDQILLVGPDLPPVSRGWQDGCLATAMGAALHVFELSGALAGPVIARGTSLDLRSQSPSAALLFAGLNAVVYRYSDASTWRVHVDRPLAAHLWLWFGKVVPLIDGSEAQQKRPLKKRP